MTLELINLNKKTTVALSYVKIKPNGVLTINALASDNMGLKPYLNGVINMHCHCYIDSDKKNIVAIKVSEKDDQTLKIYFSRYASSISLAKILTALDLEKPTSLTELNHEVKDGMLYIDLSPLSK